MFREMGCEEKKTSSYFSNLTTVKKSLGNIYAERPVFCNNGDSLIVSCGKSLHIYNTSTGNHIRELLQCSDYIIAYQLHPLELSQLLIVTEDGELLTYNLNTNEIENSIKLVLKQKFLNKQKAPKFNLTGKEGDNTFNWDKQPLDSLAHRKFLYAEVKAFHNNPSEIFVWASWCLNDELHSHLSAFTLKKGKHIKLFKLRNSKLKKCCFNFVLKTFQNLEIILSMSDDYVNVTYYDTERQANDIRHYIGHEKTLTCVAFHPVECSFATGDSCGGIIIWKNIFTKQPLKDLLHWHTLSVHDLFFSKFGNYLFSGGEENVLVKWSLNSRSKDFLPRLSSTIHHISGACESSLLSVSTMDNKILILDFNFDKISTIQHFSKWSVLKANKKPTIFALDPRNNCFVLNANTGYIQFLALNEGGRLIFTFDVTNRNFITSDSDHIIENTEVTHAKFSKDGNWLITVESRGDKLCKESRLKFWLRCEKENSFTLKTNVEFPHDDTEIHSLEISPDDMVATTGGDKKFRLWTLVESNQGFGMNQYWILHSVTKYRNFSCYAIDYSKDASLIAVTFGPILTVWETETCALKCTLSVPHGKHDLKFSKFGNNELSHLIVTGTELNISCWNIISLSILWVVPLKLSLLISDPFSIYMGAFSENNSLIIFSPSSPNPELILKEICDSPVAVAHFVSSSCGKISLYFVTSNQELHCIEDAEEVCSDIYNDTAPTFSTPYSMQVAEIQNEANFNKRKTILLNKNRKQSVSCLLDPPAHTLPNPSLLCLDVLKGLLVFSNNPSADSCHVKDVRNDDAVKISKASGDHVTVDSDKLEDKLWNIVKTLFV